MGMGKKYTYKAIFILLLLCVMASCSICLERFPKKMQLGICSSNNYSDYLYKKSHIKLDYNYIFLTINNTLNNSSTQERLTILSDSLAYKVINNFLFPDLMAVDIESLHYLYERQYNHISESTLDSTVANVYLLCVDKIQAYSKNEERGGIADDFDVTNSNLKASIYRCNTRNMAIIRILNNDEEKSLYVYSSKKNRRFEYPLCIDGNYSFKQRHYRIFNHLYLRKKYEILLVNTDDNDEVQTVATIRLLRSGSVRIKR
ncbi:MAG: hypothetical protein J6N56_04720 [Bacteroidales bacterium]|nr:hypothetical protein [Bacteroidales bacterium]